MAVSYSITLDPQALDDLNRIRVYDRRKIVHCIEQVLSANPTQVSRSRIKRLRDLDSPQFRLRVNGFRVFYDVYEEGVYVLRVLPKDAVQGYLKEMGYGLENG
jgi:mRNA-degrading endonuclease RelE of RelBE toxin-antitoxin system